MTSLVKVPLQAGGVPNDEERPLQTCLFFSNPLFSSTPMLSTVEDEHLAAADDDDDDIIVDEMAMHDGSPTHHYPHITLTAQVSPMSCPFSLRFCLHPVSSL